ncbi:unnamed protein product [Adineta ricciae]|uniref:N-acetyltransferase domain-containing protein n=1 Tax=Adineta ricciae TaxID=249248 RepID=A0A815ISK9_ADIRI|nr:unnamed protein product [Adineta ricciae]
METSRTFSDVQENLRKKRKKFLANLINTNEKAINTSHTDTTNSTSVDAPNNLAIAFLLEILSTKRPNTMLFQKDMRGASVAAGEIETGKLPFFYIQYLLVHEKYRGSDVGLNIVYFVLDSAANCFPPQYDKLICEVEAKQSALDFWKKAGFKELPGRPDDPDDVVLGKTPKRMKCVSTSIENALVLEYDSIEPVLGALVECFGHQHMNDLEKGEKEGE